MAIIQKSKDMEDMYAGNPDPWGNGASNLYDDLMKQVVDKVNELMPDSHYIWCDIGCGGGNVARGVKVNADKTDKTVRFYGVDVSENAVKFLRESSEQLFDKVEVADLEQFNYDPNSPEIPLWAQAHVVSWVEVLYYLGEKRPWKHSFNEFWKSIPSGTIVILADGLIPYQYRDYPKNHLDDAELLHSYTETCRKICEETREDGSKWTRWLKVRIYRKK